MYHPSDFSVVHKVRQKAHAFTPNKCKPQIILIHGSLLHEPATMLHKSYKKRYFDHMHNKKRYWKVKQNLSEFTES